MRLTPFLVLCTAPVLWGAPELAPNTWTKLATDTAGARPGSAMRYAPDAGVFLLWGFMNNDPDLLQELPLMQAPEYDMVSFDPAEGVWRNHVPRDAQSIWGKKLPLAYIPATYAGKTSGSERIVLHGPSNEQGGAPRPDLNLVFDQVVYHPPSKSLFYFTGGLTALYDVVARKWIDLEPAHSPPPVMTGSLAYDPVHDAVILFGGSHVAEPGPGGRLVGYTGTWIYEFAKQDWRRLDTDTQPQPRMNTRMVCDTKNRLLVVFGGDSQSHYLADTWLFDLATLRWRKSAAASGPEPRAGHFTVYDPQTGWVLTGGGYNRRNLSDMWAYDAATDRWRKLNGEAPSGFYVTGDIASEKRLIVAVTSTADPAQRRRCNMLYPVRTTYAYRIAPEGLIATEQPARVYGPMAKRPPEESTQGTGPDPARQKLQAERLASMPVNRWVHLSDPGRIPPDRTWGSATFDTNLGRILYWGGEHCGYEGNDVDSYDPSLHTWLNPTVAPEYNERMWDHGYTRDQSMGLTGLTFQGNPWNVHARKIYAYDPVSRKMIVVRPIRLTTGYSPEALAAFSGRPKAHADALVNPPGSYDKWATWAYTPEDGKWTLLGPAPESLDTLVTTPRGVIGINVDWPSRLNDSGYQLPWKPSSPAQERTVYLFDGAKKSWTLLGALKDSPQNLYESTGLAYDSKRNQLILHGGGARRDEVWTFDLCAGSWKKRDARVNGGGAPPVATREGVYLPNEDVFLVSASGRDGEAQAPDLWAYRVSEDTWYRQKVPLPENLGASRWSSQNRAMVYDAARDLVLLVVGTGGETGKAYVWALKYRFAR
jgi:hypothetical protein